MSTSLGNWYGDPTLTDRKASFRLLHCRMTLEHGRSNILPARCIRFRETHFKNLTSKASSGFPSPPITASLSNLCIEFAPAHITIRKSRPPPHQGVSSFTITPP